MIVHIVFFKFKPQNIEVNIQRVTELLNSLPQKIQSINKIEVGKNFTQSERAFDLSLYSTFNTKDDLASYATNPEHLKVLEVIKEVTTETKVVDYILES